MPFYEYECSACKYYLEAMQKISDAPLKKCPSCGKETLQRLISAPVFRLKGSGWYETDFKGDKENKRNLVQDSEPAKSDDSDKKTVVRASKALKKAVTKKAAQKVASKKATKKNSVKKTAPAKKPAAKGGAKKVAKKAVKKAVKKSGSKPTKKAAGKKSARKK